MRISDWSSDVCSSDLLDDEVLRPPGAGVEAPAALDLPLHRVLELLALHRRDLRPLRLHRPLRRLWRLLARLPLPLFYVAQDGYQPVLRLPLLLGLLRLRLLGHLPPRLARTPGP